MFDISCFFRSKRIQAAAFFIASIWIPAAFCQTTGTVTGTVSDPQGASIAGAGVTITNSATGATQQAETSSSGGFQFLLLPPGGYVLESKAPGFSNFRRTGIVVDAGSSQAVPIEMAVGQASQTVDVAAGAVLLEANTSEVSTTMETAKIQDLPLNGRNPFALANLIPAVRGDLVFGGPVTKTFRGSQVNIGGGPDISNGFLIDGLPNDKIVDAPGPLTFLTADATEEFRVQTNAYSAEYGRSVGGVISVISKSGTNDYHGLVSYYWRNTDFVANDFFSNKSGIGRQEEHLNNPAATFGGPIKKNKIFFFSNFEWYRNQQGFGRIVTVPTALQEKGDFSQTVTSSGAPIIIYDPSTTTVNSSGQYIRTPFMGNMIPISRQSQVARDFLALMPAPNIAAPITNINNEFQAGVQPTDRNVEGIKVDDQLTQNQRIAVRFTRDDVQWTYPNYYHSILETEGRLTDVPRKSLTIGYTNVLSPSLLLDIKAGYNRDNEIAHSPFEQQQYGGNFNLNTLGFPSSFVSALPTDRGSPKGKLPEFIISDAGTYAGDNSDYRAGADTAASAMITKIMSKHSVKAGYQYTFYNEAMGGGGFAATIFNFNRTYTQGPVATSATSTGGFGTASFLLGDVSSSADGGIVPVQAQQMLGQKFSALFVEDDWKATKKLTFNLGLRWEYEAPMTDRFNQFTNFNFNVPSPLAANPALAGLNLMGAASFGTGGFTKPDWNHYGPRAGLAYQVNNKLVFRAGYGIMWIPTKGNPVNQFSGFRVANPMTASINGGLTPYNTLDNPYPNGLNLATGNSLGASTSLGTDMQFTAYNTNPGYAQQWNTTLQYQPWNNWLFEAAYTGNRGIHLMTSQPINYDQINPSYLSLGSALNQSVANPFFGIFTSGPLSTATITRQQSLLPYPQYNLLQANYAFLGDSIYHSVDIKIEHKFSQGFSVLLAFVGSKLLSDAAGNKVNGNTIVDWYDLRSDRARDGEDVPRRLVLTALYAIPFGQHLGGWKQAVAYGWHVNGIMTIQSGFPIKITSGSANYPNEVPGCNPQLAHPTLSEWFNTACFTIPAAFTYGNASPTIPNVNGPPLKNVDASIFRDFLFRERYRLQVRAEAFNVFNHPYFAAPGGDVTSASFGVVSAVGTVPPNTSGPAPRALQFSLRLNF